MEAREEYTLLEWSGAAKAPVLEPIEILDIEDRDDVEWVIFRFIDPEAGGQSGAPAACILTERERDWVEKTWGFVHKSREEARRLNRAAQRARKDLIRVLSERSLIETLMRE